MQTGELGLRGLQRTSQDKLRDCSHTDPERQQVREALNLLVTFDKQRGDMDPALEAVEDAFRGIRCDSTTPHPAKTTALALHW